MTKTLSLMLFLTLLLSCGRQTNVDASAIQSQIYGGKKSPHQWPSVVALTNRKGGLVCSGIALNTKTVLTAAHCLSYPNITKNAHEYFSIYLGEGSTHRIFGKYKIASYRIHPYYDPKDDDSPFDFALIYLQNKLPLKPKDFIKILNESKVEKLLQVHQEITIVGFGRNENNLSGEKSAVSTFIWQIDNDEFFAGGGHQDSCHGDSGGPALIELEDKSLGLIGITSRPAAPGQGCGYGTVFGTISSAFPWPFEK